MIDAGHGSRRSESRNILLRFAAIYGVSAILGMGTYYGYRFYFESNNDGFLKGTVVDGEDVSGLSAEAAERLICQRESRLLWLRDRQGQAPAGPADGFHK